MEIEDKLIIARLMDKIKICKTRNRIVNTEFLTPYQREIIRKELNKMKIKNFLFFGGYKDAEGQILIIYPEKLELEFVQKDIDNILKAIRIKLPKEVVGKYNHRDYLGALMKTGLNRNRIGDIIVHEDGADVVVLKENADYIASFMKDLVRFNKALVEVISYTDMEIKEPEFDEINISVSSMRLDNVVSEIARTSRNKAEELLLNEKVFVNSKQETKSAKLVKENDVLAIRGSGKYIICELLGNNKKGKYIVKVKKYK